MSIYEKFLLLYPAVGVIQAIASIERIKMLADFFEESQQIDDPSFKRRFWTSMILSNILFWPASMWGLWKALNRED